MSPLAVQSLVALCPLIKEQWGGLLRGEPTITPLGRPDTLVFLMDATLAQLIAGLTDGSESRHSTRRWLRDCPPVVGPIHRYCACGLNPLLKYYTTGELALRAGAGGALGSKIEDALLLYRALAQQEIETLCGVCQHKNTPGCVVRPSPPLSIDR